MPRIAPGLLRKAQRQSPNLAQILLACRDLESARNELRWITKHVSEAFTKRKGAQIRKLCRQRSKGVPLQYLLGSQPFGSLDIKCVPGVLIPRPETEAYTCHLADLLKNGAIVGLANSPSQANDLRVVDICSGTGCIPLLLFSLLQKRFHSLTVNGIDISAPAVNLARENISRNVRMGLMSPPNNNQRLHISRGDVFRDEDVKHLEQHRCDVLISNPPYISENTWNLGQGQLGYSVRKYEPALALVPGRHLPLRSGCSRADVFYGRILDIAERLRPRVILFEIGDESQARRVLSLFRSHRLSQEADVELWRDSPDISPHMEEEASISIPLPNEDLWTVPIKGSGGIRSIVIHTVLE